MVIEERGKQLQESYPALPRVERATEGMVPIETLEQIADFHAQEIWGQTIARGEPIPLVNEMHTICAFAFPFVRDRAHFPKLEQIVAQVRTIRSTHQALAPTDMEADITAQLGDIGMVYVSSTHQTAPILGVTHFLHPFFLVGDLAQAEARRTLAGEEPILEHILFLGPDTEYFEFSGEGNTVLIHTDSLEQKTFDELLQSVQPTSTSPERSTALDAEWERVIQLSSGAATAEDTAIAATPIMKLMPHWQLVPIVPWTWWCVPTAFSMVVGYWDNYVKHHGTILGYGRFIRHWIEHQYPKSRGNNVPDFLDVLIDPTTGTWRKGFANFADFIKKTYGYNVNHQRITANSSNDWAWHSLTQEIDRDRPAVWGTWTPNHANAAIGYRITSSGEKFVIVYSTWGKTAQAQRREWNYTLAKGMESLIFGGGTNGNHLVLFAPDGGEAVKNTPCTITWYVWGQAIKKVTLWFSEDGGNTWSVIASNLSAQTGWNSYQWRFPRSTKRARIRIHGYTQSGAYVAADGSQNNVTVQMAWNYNTRVIQTHAKNSTQMTWAVIDGIGINGWVQVQPQSPDGVSNVFLTLCEALANHRRVHVYVQNGQILQATLV